jgi:hypothetical protein
VGPDAPAESGDERRGTNDDDIARGYRLSGSNARLHVAAHAPWLVHPLAAHLGVHCSRILLRPHLWPERHEAGKYRENFPHNVVCYQNRTMRRSFLFFGIALTTSCDNAPSPNPQATPAASVARQSAPAADTASASPPPVSQRAMPPRPVPTTSPTVLITMPQEVQLQAIQYMAAMQAPQPSDAPADPDYAKQIADRLRAVGKTDVISSGRRIDLQLEKGCDATLPRESIARQSGASLTALLAHGVLVVRCADHSIQCLQSTRDANDVLCTHK